MRLYFLMIISVVMLSCNKEAALTPSDFGKLYTLPQGNNSYDDSIMACYNKYQTYILYKFTQQDYVYNYIELKTDSAFVANPLYISAALRFLHTELLNVYPESFLQKTMPFKILLAAYLGSGTNRNPKGFASTISMLAIGWADSALAQKTPAELKLLRGYMHRYYNERAYRVDLVKVPAEFAALAPALYGSVNAANKYSLGVLDPHGNDLNLASDFLSYIEVITSQSKAQLEAGILRPAVDTKGLIRKKYNIVLNYFQTGFGVDLQAIGERP
ncbi:hypothetical protein [uncultured Chitinophaga sp.]|uniref:hypothetical protein n=1 Tax=uncultured Chitinophaga sp. TaxID=339340 RepID=UPI0025D2D283|nr:hypothetical protein [uncultured Chitinophaga sp.]